MMMMMMRGGSKGKGKAVQAQQSTAYSIEERIGKGREGRIGRIGEGIGDRG